MQLQASFQQFPAMFVAFTGKAIDEADPQTCSCNRVSSNAGAIRSKRDLRHGLGSRHGFFSRNTVAGAGLSGGERLQS